MVLTSLRSISIHAPREGSDVNLLVQRSNRERNFYPRSPRGERLLAPPVCLGERGISIHAPREGSDRLGTLGKPHGAISIHAPREGSDIGMGRVQVWSK